MSCLFISPQVGTNLTDLTFRKKKKKVTLRELGGCMGPIWPSYFKDCSSVIVCFYFMYLQYSTFTVGTVWLCLCVFTVYGGLCQHCSDIFILCPAAVGTLCWTSTKRFCAYSLQQEVTLTPSPPFTCNDCWCHLVNIIRIPSLSESLSCYNVVSYFKILICFQGFALHHESHRDKILVQNGWHHSICSSTSHSTGGQCSLWTGTSGGAELAGVHYSQVNYYTYVPYWMMLLSQGLKLWLQAFWQKCQSSMCKDCSHIVLKRISSCWEKW